MIKVVINRCYGGFGLSNAAYEWLIKNRGWRVTEYTKDGRDYVDPTAHIVDHGSYMSSEYPELSSKLLSERRYYPTRSASETEFRTNQDVIDVVKKLGKKANGACAELAIVEIPDDVAGNWEIGEYDGTEWVQECHRRWS